MSSNFPASRSNPGVCTYKTLSYCMNWICPKRSNFVSVIEYPADVAAVMSMGSSQMLYFVLAVWRRERAVAIGSDCFAEDIWSHSCGYMNRRS